MDDFIPSHIFIFLVLVILLGAVVATLLIWPKKSLNGKKGAFFSYAVPLSVLILGILITLASTAYVYSLHIHSERQNFIQSAIKFSSALQGRLRVHINSLISARSLFDSSVFVDRQEFSLFARHIVEGYPEISGIYYIKAVDKRTLEEHILETQAFYPSYEIKSFNLKGVGPDNKVFSVFYAEPGEQMSGHIGYDLATHPSLIGPIRKALQESDPVLSPFIDEFSFSKDQPPRRKLVIFLRVNNTELKGNHQASDLIALFIDSKMMREEIHKEVGVPGFETKLMDGTEKPADDEKNGTYWDVLSFKGGSLYLRYTLTDKVPFKDPKLDVVVLLVSGLALSLLLAIAVGQHARVRKFTDNLKESQERYTLGVEGAGTILWDWDMISQSFKMEGNALQIFGAKSANQLPRDVAGMHALIPAEDLERIERDLATYLAGDMRNMFSIEYRLTTLDGRHIWLVSRGKVTRFEDGKPVRMGGTLIDITERKRAEEIAMLYQKRLEAILDNMVDGLITIDERGYIQTFNKACENLFGYAVEDMVGENINILMPEEYASHHDEYLKNYLTTGERKIIGIGREVEGLRKDGSVFPIDLSVAEVRLPTGRIFSGIIRDITQRKEFEKTLLRSNKELEQFAYVASHDLKAPLRSIDNLAKWVIEDTAEIMPADAKEKLDLLRGRIGRLETLLDDILAYSRAGRILDEPQTIDLHDMVQSLGQIYLPDSFRLEIEGRLPVLVSSRTPLEQIFGNIFSNAVKHHDKKEGVIKVSATDTGNFYEILVADDGPGIPPEFHERAFQMFQTLQPRDKVDGSGLGMAIMKKLVEWQNGKIWIDYANGDRGAAIHFCWPKVFRK